MEKSEKTMDVLRQVVIVSLSTVITGGHIGPVLAMSAQHKLDGKSDSQQNVQTKFAQLGTYAFLQSANLELTKPLKLGEITGASLSGDRVKFSATKLNSFNLSPVADQLNIAENTVGYSLEKKSKSSFTKDQSSPSSLNVFPLSLNKSDKYIESFAKNLHKKNLSSDLLNSPSHNLTVNKLAKPSIVEAIENTANNSLVTTHENNLSNHNIANNVNNLDENIILTSINDHPPIQTVRDIEKVNTQSSVLLKSDQGLSQSIAQAEGGIDSNSYPPPVPNGTLQTNPPAGINPVPNPLYVPNTPAAVQLQGSVSLTLQQAIDIARRNNTTLQTSELELAQSRERVRQAQAALLPQLDLQSNATWQLSPNGDIQERATQKRARKEGVDLPEDDTQNIANFTVDTSLSLSYDTGIDGARGARIRATEKEVLLRELEFERLTEEVRLQTSADYFELQESDGRVKIGEAAVANAKKSLADAEALERAGVGTRFDVLQSQVTLSNEQQNLTNALRDQRVAKRRLAQTLNVAQTVEITAADPIEPAGSWQFSLDETIIQAFNNRAELEQQLVRRDLNDEERKIALSAMRPRLILFASYDVLFLAPNDNNVYLPRGWGDGYSVGARMSWNLFDGGDARSRARQSELDKQISEIRFEETRNDVRIQVERAFFELEASFENIGTAELGLEQAKEALRLARLRFQAGVGTQLEVINQETDLTRAQISLLVAIINYNRSLSALQRAVSNLPDNNLSDTP